MKKGWIALHRQIMDHWIWQNPEQYRAWNYLLFMANHEEQDVPFREGIVHVERGQLITSIGKLAESWKWSKDRVRRFLTLLSDTNMIIRVSDRRKTTITIVNYGVYQNLPSSDKYTDKTSNKTSGKTSRKTRTTINNNEEQFITSDPPPSDEVAVAEEEDVGMTDEEWENWGEVFTP